MNIETVLKEASYKAVRSSGPGGQHVNKVASKIELSFDLMNSKGLTEDEIELLLKKLQSKLSKDAVLLLQCGTTRSQHKNKEIVQERLITILQNGLKVPKKRKATKPSKASIKKRLENKKKKSLQKSLRNKRIDD